ncbi:MAG TPA: FHA domain-containing protein [Clostridia bacterium]|nr:FHA domain-containing protein [Clostridia bacterium]
MFGIPYERIYEVLAFVLSLCFPAMAAVIVLRAAFWVRRDHRLRRRALQALPDAGTIGELTVIRGGGNLLEQGACIPIPHEGILGSARACDIVLPHEDVPGRAAHFALTRDGLCMTPWRGTALRVNGQSYPNPVTLVHGNTLQWGGLRLRLRLFEGTEALAAAKAPVATSRARRKADAGPTAEDVIEAAETAEPVGEPEIDIPMGVEHRPVRRNLRGRSKVRRKPK